MTHCPQCGVENPDQAKFCGACGGRMEAVQPLPAAASAAVPAMRGMAPAPAIQPEQHFAAMRGMAVTPFPKPEEPHATMRGPAPASDAEASAPAGARFAVGKNSTTATLLSVLFPGIGQFYNGDTRKGLHRSPGRPS